jgi:hypothetical protein
VSIIYRYSTVLRVRGQGNQPGLLAAVAQALAGPDSDLADSTWTE